MRSWGTSKSWEDGDGAGTGRPARRPARLAEREILRTVLPEWAIGIPEAVGMVPTTAAVLTAAFEHKRAGLMVHRMMRCGDEPACVAIALLKGHRLATLIRDSHAFGLSLFEDPTRLMLKKFADGEEGDPFDTFPVRTLATGSPLLTRAKAALDCEVMRHYDLDSDHEIYVGQVISAMVFASAQVAPVFVGRSDAVATQASRLGDSPAGIAPAATPNRPGDSGNGHNGHGVGNGHASHAHGSAADRTDAPSQAR